MKEYAIYILASNPYGALYIGFTDDLIRRVYEHKIDAVKGFTKKYRVHSLVYYETDGNYEGALKREKQLKAWKRQWKIELIEAANPEWRDLYYDIIPGASDRPRRK